MRFIKLTIVKQIQTRNVIGQDTNTHSFFKERYFNADKIENFIQLNGVTHMCMSSSAAYGVMETPKEIIELIKQAEEI